MLWILGIILGIVFILFAGAILSINVKNEKKPIEPPGQSEELMDVPLPEEPEKKPTKDENWEQRRLEAYRYLQMVGKEHQLNERELDVKHGEQEVEIRELKSNLVDIGLDQKGKDVEQKIKEGELGLQEKALELKVKDIEQKIMDGNLGLREQALEMNEGFFAREQDLAKRELNFKVFAGELRLRMFELLIKEAQQKHIEFLWNEYKTLDIQKIQLMNEENTLRMKYAMKELALIQKDIEQKKEDLLLKEWESDLHVEFNKLKLKENAWDYIEQRVLVRAGIKTQNIDAFVNGFVRWDNRAREFGHEGAEGFMKTMFNEGYYKNLIGYKQQYHQLLAEVEQLRLDAGEN